MDRQVINWLTLLLILAPRVSFKLQELKVTVVPGDTNFELLQKLIGAILGNDAGIFPKALEARLMLQTGEEDSLGEEEMEAAEELLDADDAKEVRKERQKDQKPNSEDDLVKQMKSCVRTWRRSSAGAASSENRQPPMEYWKAAERKALISQKEAELMLPPTGKIFRSPLQGRWMLVCIH